MSPRKPPSLRDLQDDVRRLAKELIATHEQTVTTSDGGENTGKVPGLLAQLRKAVGTGGERGRTAGRRGVPAPISPAAHDLMEQIDRDTTELYLQAQKVISTPEERIRALAALAGRWTEPSKVAVLRRYLHQWVTEIQTSLTPTRRLELVDPCPACGAATAVVEKDGEEVVTRALSVDEVDGARCAACGHHWPPSHLRLLAGAIGAPPLACTVERRINMTGWDDLWSEYGQVFARLGMSESRADAVLHEALRFARGVRRLEVDLDQLADALKEFVVLAEVDGELSEAELLARLQGAATRLRGIDDPVEQRAAAVRLFGTSAEGLGADLVIQLAEWTAPRLPDLVLFSHGLCSKWGFSDGEEPEWLWDWCQDHEVDWGAVPWAAVLRQLVREHLVPALAKHHEVEVEDVETNHNPIRATRIDGQEIDDTGDADLHPALTPEWVTVPGDVVVAVVREHMAKEELR